MYKIFTSLWSSKTSSSSSQIDNQIPFESETLIDEDDWVLVAPKSKTIDQTTTITTHHFNPIENLLIEHASMSVYEQIAFRTRHRKIFDDELKIDDNEEINNDNNQTSIVFQYQSQYPIASLNDQQNLNVSFIDSTMGSLPTQHNRHANRFHQRRKRSIKINHIDKSITLLNKTLERQRLNFARTPKLTLHQPSRSNH